MNERQYNASQSIELAMLLMVVGREALNQSPLTMMGVAKSIANRVGHPSWWGQSWLQVIEHKWAYSSMTAPGDPNLVKYPVMTDKAWQIALQCAESAYWGVGTDPTNGATDYFDRSLDAHPPGWATDGSHICTVSLGAIHFWKQVDSVVHS